MRKIGLVGAAGGLGSMVGYNLALNGLADEIVYIDLLREKASAQALDTGHGIIWEQDVDVYQGNYEDARDADIFVVTAGKPRRPGMSRLDLVDANKNIIKEVAKKIDSVAPEALSVITTNPLDVMNFALYRFGNRPRQKVIGEAGMLDSARFRHALAQKFRVKFSEVKAFVVGEHGDSQVPLFSRVVVKGEKKHIEDEEEQREILETLRESSMKIIEGKGATTFGPARAVTLMVDSILNDKRKVYPCSVIPRGEYGLKDGSIGLPVRLGSNGVEEIIEWNLSKKEKEALERSHEKILRICKEKIS